MYQNINIILGTKHHKEQAISEPFQTAFSASIIVPDDFDTDVFGTFTGEIPRNGSALETVIAKAKFAANKYGYDYAIANEGSFGPHPVNFFIPADIELMVFADLKQDIIIVESELSTETNFSYLDIQATDHYTDFLTKMKFGTHGLILKSMDNNHILAKGVVERTHLKQLLDTYFQQYQYIRLETDMRAMHNPTRMKVIHQLAKKLVARIKTPCKACQTPGFGKVTVQGKLPCKSCGSETTFHESLNLACIKCDYSENHPREDGLLAAEQMYCTYCNP